jgi:hypothetical protein
VPAKQRKLAAMSENRAREIRRGFLRGPLNPE